MIALADLKPGQRVYIYSDVPVEVVSVEPERSCECGRWILVRLNYRLSGTVLVGRLTLSADTELRLVEESVA